jgi:hypothetical protein
LADECPLAAITQAESLVAPGGLRVRDTATSLTVSPGCCRELEDWQEWNKVAAGQSALATHFHVSWPAPAPQRGS